MKISILTISPEEFSGLGHDHVIDRAVKTGQLTLDIVDIRSFADGCFRKVDDSPYGGGAGMIMRITPVMNAVRRVRKENEDTCVIALSPTGKRYDQKTAGALKNYEHLIIICGHYEGLDERIYEHADRIISMGDYILSGGEIAAMAIADSVARLLPGVIRESSLAEESFTDGLLEYPQYTKPADYEGQKVPEVLLSGNHEAIRAWRREQAQARTRRYRPDLLSEQITGEERWQKY